jgi:hypothetical protein
MDRVENTASNNSSIVASRNCRTDHVENTASQLAHWCVLGICCLPTGVVYRVIILQRVYMLQYSVPPQNSHLILIWCTLSNLYS